MLSFFFFKQWTAYEVRISDWSSDVCSSDLYVPGEQPKLQDLVKLNTNEHPFGPSPKVLQAMRAACHDNLKLYPDPGSERPRLAIAAYFQVQPHPVSVGHGLDEVPSHAVLELATHVDPAPFPHNPHNFYPEDLRLF